MARTGSSSAPPASPSPSAPARTSAAAHPIGAKSDGKPDGRADAKPGPQKAPVGNAASDTKTSASVSGPAAKGGSASSAPGSSVEAKPSAPPSPTPPAPTPSKEKLQALGTAVGQIEKTFGKGSIMKLDENAYMNIPGISTGAISLDLALGGKGIPRGRIIEVFGPESSGKTTLALTVLAQAQKAGGVAAFIDAEHALDPTWARKIGVNIDEMLVSQPDTGEQALEICELLVRSNAVDVIVIDSVAALIPRAEIEGEMGDAVVGLQARLMSQAMRKLTGVIARTNSTVIFINQIREKIGVMFGSPETTTGGRALKFYSSVRIDIRRTSSIKEGEVAVGNRVRARVVKNKVAAPFREAEFDIMFDEGISLSGDLLDLAVSCEVIDKSGAWFTYKDVRLGQGRENAKRFLKENKDLFDEVRRGVLATKVSKPVAVKVAADDAESDD
ncbi:MAG: recombinase RecA [Phycisphaeraceae bacterium]|nr:recombinase RecA [Phycisphaeraceae bacterium]